VAAWVQQAYSKSRDTALSKTALAGAVFVFVGNIDFDDLRNNYESSDMQRTRSAG
jgi:hypothetical protein